MFQLCNPKHVVFHYDVRRDLVETIDGIVIYSSYHNCVVSLKWLTKSKRIADDKLLIKLCLDLFIVLFTVDT